jgi:hypothetical protein
MRSIYCCAFLLLLLAAVAQAKQSNPRPEDEILLRLRRANDDQVAALRGEAEARAALLTATTTDARAEARLKLETAQQTLLAARTAATNARQEMDAAEKAAALDLARARLRALRAGRCSKDTSLAETELDSLEHAIDEALATTRELDEMNRKRRATDLERAKADVVSAKSAHEAAETLMHASIGTTSYYQIFSWFEQTGRDLSAAEDRVRALEQLSWYGAHGDKFGEALEALSTKLEDAKSDVTSARISIE